MAERWVREAGYYSAHSLHSLPFLVLHIENTFNDFLDPSEYKNIKQSLPSFLLRLKRILDTTFSC